MNSRIQNLILAVILLCGVVMCVLTASFAYRTNDGFGFPLDDPWIHLQFAKNLHDFGAFSYFKNEMVTSGSTSPLYTFLLAAGFFITNNEMILSYTMGVLFLVIAGMLLFKNSMKLFDGDFLSSAVAALLLLFEPRLMWIALSGMETTLFIALLLTVWYCYLARGRILLGIMSGLLLWARPEAFLFVIVMILDVAYHNFIVTPVAEKKKPERTKKESLSWMKLPAMIFCAFGLMYVGFNYLLSGSILPNTYAAKLKYYSNDVTDFPVQFFHFLADGHLIILACFVAIGVIALSKKITRRKPAVELIPALWTAGMFLAYWKNLPHLFQEGRYLMPVLPFVIFLGLSGVKKTLDIAKNVLAVLRNRQKLTYVTVAILAIIAMQFMAASWDKRTDYADYCKYISDRQVRTAKWLHDNLPPNAIVATHDIGAVAFYSGRKVVDMVGLVSPEMVNYIGRLDKLKQFLIAKKVTHLAVLRNWFDIVNQNSIYHTDEERPEIMEVFQFDPIYTYITPRNAGDMTEAAGYYLAIGNIQQAGPLLEQSLKIDPQSSKTHLMLGNAFLATSKLDRAEAEFNTAIKLHPSYWDAELGLAQLTLKKNKPQEAVARIETIVQQNPKYVPGYRLLAQVYRSYHLDSAKADFYLRQYNQLSGESIQ